MSTRLPEVLQFSEIVIAMDIIKQKHFRRNANIIC